MKYTKMSKCQNVKMAKGKKILTNMFKTIKMSAK